MNFPRLPAIALLILLSVPKLLLAESAEIVAHWPLAGSAVNTAAERCNGEVIGDATFRDSALRLNGGYVNFGTDSWLSVTGSLSFCLWMKPEEESRIMRIAGKFENEGGNREFCSFVGADKRCWAFLSDDGSSDEGHAILKTTAQPVVTNGTWSHLAVTWESGKGAGGLLIYVDGWPVPLLTAQGPDIRSLRTGTAGLTLGAYDTGSQQSGVLSNTFHGAMSDFRLFRGVLTEDEIAAICDADHPAGANLTPATHHSGVPKSVIASPVEDRSLTSIVKPVGTNLVSGADAQTNGVIIVPGVPDGRTIYVDKKIGQDSLSGKEPVVVGADGPKRTIRAGLFAAGSGDKLIIKEGRYGEDLNVAGRNISVRMEGNVNLSGGTAVQLEVPVPSIPTNTPVMGVTTNAVK